MMTSGTKQTSNPIVGGPSSPPGFVQPFPQDAAAAGMGENTNNATNDEQQPEAEGEDAFILSSASFRPRGATAAAAANNIGGKHPIVPGGVGGGRARSQPQQQQRRRPPAAISFSPGTSGSTCSNEFGIIGGADGGWGGRVLGGVGSSGGQIGAATTAATTSGSNTGSSTRNSNDNASIGLLGGIAGSGSSNSGPTIRLQLQSRLRLSSSLQQQRAAADASGKVVGGTSSSRRIRPPPGLGLTSQTQLPAHASLPNTASVSTTINNTNANAGGMKMGRNGLGHKTMVVISPLPLGDVSNTYTNGGSSNNTNGSSPPKTVTTLKLSAQSSLYSPRLVPANNTATTTTSTTPTTDTDRRSANNNGIGSSNSTATTSSSRPSSSASNGAATSTRQLQWFTPIKQEGRDRDNKGTNGSINSKMASASSIIATPTTVATTPPHSIGGGSSLLLSGGGATPGGGECFLRSICSGSSEDDDTAFHEGTGGGAGVMGGRDSRSCCYFGSGTTPIPTTVVGGRNGCDGAGRDGIVSPLPILSDITNTVASANNARGSNNICDGFVTPRKADRKDTADKPPPTPTMPPPPSKKATTSSPAASPPPQNLRGDPHRQAKVKTELCLYYLKDVVCPFGERCNYAHGWDELRFKRLQELERNGLIPNAAQYRTHPCLSWITTGSCPFGQRCSSIHDPRAAGSTNSWMPFADSPVTNLDTTVNVDKFYHRHNGSLHSSNPLVGQVFWEKCRPSTLSAKPNDGSSSKKGCFGVDAAGKPQQSPIAAPRSFSADIDSGKNDVRGAREWSDTYSLVCNHDTSRSPPSHVSSPPTYTLMSKASFTTALAAASAGDISGGSSTGGSTSANGSAGKKIMTEEQRLSIALLMSCGDDLPRHDDYIYVPSHLIFGELCMILQTRYFRLLSSDETFRLEYDAPNEGLRTSLNSVREISIDEYNASRTPWDKRHPYSPQSVIVARKIAFGSVGEANANVSLWFDTPASQIAPCTPQMVKRLKRVRSKAQMLNGNKRKDPSSPAFPPLPFQGTLVDPSVTNPVAESFHSVTYQPFFFTLVANNDPAATKLVRDILLHRIRTLRGNDPALALSNEDRTLQDRYFALKRSMEKWQWPPCAGRGRVDANTKVPECIAKYCLPPDGSSKLGFGNSDRYVAQVYGSFLDRASQGYVETEIGDSLDMSFGGVHTTFGRPRLATPRLLSEGISVPQSKWNQPLVRGDFYSGSNNAWKGWDLVKSHYAGEGKAAMDGTGPSSPSTDTPARTHALPLGSSGEKRDSIFMKMQQTASQ